MTVAAILVAAGSGSRFPGPRPKQFLDLGGKPVVAHALARIGAHPAIGRIVLVLPPRGFQEHEARATGWVRGATRVEMAPGGKERQDSVGCGLARLSRADGDFVLVHDGARPLVGGDVLDRVIRAAEETGAALAALPVYETLKEVDARGIVTGTVDRARYRRAQTPQCFRYELLVEAFDRARAEGFLGTDEAALVERLGVPVRVVPGSEANIKITTPEDLALAEWYLAREGRAP